MHVFLLIQWNKLTSEGRVVVQTGGVYTVPAATSSDAGRYECAASNSYATPTRSTEVQVTGTCLVYTITTAKWFTGSAMGSGG